MGRQQQFQLLKGVVRQTLLRRFHNCPISSHPPRERPSAAAVESETGVRLLSDVIPNSGIATPRDHSRSLNPKSFLQEPSSRTFFVKYISMLSEINSPFKIIGFTSSELPHHSSSPSSGVEPLQHPFRARNSLTDNYGASALTCWPRPLRHSGMPAGRTLFLSSRSAVGGRVRGGEASRGFASSTEGGEGGAGGAGGGGEGGEGGEGGDKPAAEEKPARRKKLTKKQRFGKYDQDFEDEMAQIPIDESIEHLYDARPIFEEWMGHPSFYDMISADAYPKKGAPKDEPPGEGPILRWQTRVVLSPGGEGFHPKNRKVKVSVYVKELELTPAQKERLLFMVGKRYNPNKDELTIVSERFDQREENRKDVLRTLLALIEEAKKEDDVQDDAQQA